MPPIVLDSSGRRDSPHSCDDCISTSALLTDWLRMGGPAVGLLFASSEVSSVEKDGGWGEEADNSSSLAEG